MWSGKILNDHYQKSLKCMVKFNSKNKSISTHTALRELKGLRLNNCVALRWPFVSEANRAKKGFNFIDSIKIRL